MKIVLHNKLQDSNEPNGIALCIVLLRSSFLIDFVPDYGTNFHICCLQDYSPSFGDPLALDTSDLVTTVSETVLKAVAVRSPTVLEADEDSDEMDDGEEFFTASEGEEDDVCGDKGQFRSSTKLLLNFSISEVCVYCVCKLVSEPNCIPCRHLIVERCSSFKHT